MPILTTPTLEHMSQEAKTAIGNLLREALEGHITPETLQQMDRIPEERLPAPWGHFASFVWGYNPKYYDSLTKNIVDEIRCLCSEMQDKLRMEKS